MSEEELDKNEEIKQVLIIGIAGGLAQILARLILQDYPHWEVIGVDSRGVDHVEKIKGLTLLQFKFSRGNFEKIFRENQFDYVYHLARISHSQVGGENLTKRLELSVMGTNRILDLSLRFGVKKAIVLSTFHVYGALADNSIFLTEDAPLKASMNYPQLRDVVEMDQICINWMYKYQSQMDTVVLRPCNIIGSKIQNTMTKYLNSHFALKPIDYNPIFQFIHEFDMAKVLYRSIAELPTGVYNVATDEFISLNDAINLVSKKGIPFPMFLAGQLNKILHIGHLNVPDYLIDYLKYSCLINNSQLKKYLGENFYRFKIDETIKLSSI